MKTNKSWKLAAAASVAAIALALAGRAIVQATPVGHWMYDTLTVNNIVVEGSMTPPPVFYATQTVSAQQLTSTYGVNGATLTITGAATVSTTLGVTGALTAPSIAGTVRFSTGTSAGATSCHFFGAIKTTLPTTYGTECDLVYNLTDHKLYVATKTVAAVDDWAAAY